MKRARIVRLEMTHKVVPHKMNKFPSDGVDGLVQINIRETRFIV